MLTARRPSRVLDDDRSQGTAHVVAGVERLLQALEELLVLDQADGVGLGPEHRRDLAAEDPVPLALQLVQQLTTLANAVEVLQAAEVSHRGLDRLACLANQRGQLATARGQ